MLRFYYIIFFMLCSATVFSLNITIDAGAVADVNIDNTGGVITPTGPGATLTDESLTAALGVGNVTINTNGAGDIEFINSPIYSASAERTLNLIADGDILTMNNSTGTSSAVNYIIQATGDVIITINGINTFGGDVDIEAGGMITINNAGMNVGAADHVNLMANGPITIEHSPLESTNPNLSLLIDATTSHDISFYTDMVGGKVELIGNNIETLSDGLDSSGSTEVNIYAAGDFTASSNGIGIAGGSIAICAGNNVLVQHGGVNSGGGSISIQAEGTITLDSSTDSSPGTGGVLTVTEGSPGSIIQNTSPNVGAGDILLNTNYVFSPPAPPATVPTIGQWGLIILGLLLMIFGVIAIIDSKVPKVSY